MLNDAALVVASNAVEAAVTHLQIHSAQPDAGYTTNVVGTRSAATGSVDADGDITWTASWTGLTANQAVSHVSYWSASTGGTNYGGEDVSGGDLTANAAGEFNITVTETSTAS